MALGYRASYARVLVYGVSRDEKYIQKLLFSVNTLYRYIFTIILFYFRLSFNIIKFYSLIFVRKSIVIRNEFYKIVRIYSKKLLKRVYSFA